MGGLCPIVKHKGDQRFAAVNGSGQLGAGKAVVQRIAVRDQLTQVFILGYVQRDLHGGGRLFRLVALGRIIGQLSNMNLVYRWLLQCMMKIRCNHLSIDCMLFPKGCRVACYISNI